MYRMRAFAKKISCIIFCLVLFTSCTQNSGKTETSVHTEVTAPPLAFKIGGELPDIGKFSGGSPEHFHGGYTEEFIPSDDYGMVLPYIGNIREFSSGGDFDMSQDYAYYGFCTPDGKIVLDATIRNHYINYREADDGFGYYILSRDIEEVSDAPDEYIPSEMLLIPLSGKWCIKVEPNCYVTAAADGVICIENYTQRTAELYDYDGNRIGEITDIDGVGNYSCGLMSVYSFDDSYSKSTVRYVDKEGNTVLGPYHDGGGFNKHGVTFVRDTDGFCKLINTDGDILVDKAYTGVSDYETVYTFTDEYKSGVDIYSAKGEFIGRAEGPRYLSLRFPNDGEIVYSYSDFSGELIATRLSDGEHIVNSEYGVSPNSYSSTDEIYVYENPEESFVLLMDYMGNTVAAFDDCTGFINSVGQRYIAYTTGNTQHLLDEDGKNVTVSDRTVHVYDNIEKKVLFSASGSGYMEFYGDRYIFMSVYDESDFFGGKPRCYLYDTAEGKMIFDECRMINAVCIGGEYYYAVCEDNKCALYDNEMNMILKVYNE